MRDAWEKSLRSTKCYPPCWNGFWDFGNIIVHTVDGTVDGNARNVTADSFLIIVTSLGGNGADLVWKYVTTKPGATGRILASVRCDARFIVILFGRSPRSRARTAPHYNPLPPVRPPSFTSFSLSLSLSLFPVQPRDWRSAARPRS